MPPAHSTLGAFHALFVSQPLSHKGSPFFFTKLLPHDPLPSLLRHQPLALYPKYTAVELEVVIIEYSLRAMLVPSEPQYITCQ